MKILFIRCPNSKCRHKIDVDQMQTQRPRGTACDVCGATFSFSNGELEIHPLAAGPPD